MAKVGFMSSALDAYLRARRPGAVFVVEDFGRRARFFSGVGDELFGDPALEGSGQRLDRMSDSEVAAFLGRPQQAALNKPAQPINCVNCGAPRVRASSACCDYCGSV